jgi:hypothetical protein
MIAAAAPSTARRETRPAAATRSALVRLAPALVLLAAAVADSGRYADTDLWGHIFFGKMMLRRGPYLGGDPFSYSASGHLWPHHEWLMEASMAWLYGHFGIYGLKLGKFACSLVTVGFLSLAEGETGAPVPLQFAILLAAAFALAPFMQFRPQLASFMMLAAFMAALARDSYRGRGRLWLAIPALALWANLHGGFFIGVLALGIYAAVSGMRDLAAGHGLARGLRLTAITIAGALATLATPYGFGTWKAVAISVANPMTRQIMADWRPLLVVLAGQLREPHGGAIYLAAAIAIIAACAIAFALTPGSGDAALAAIAATLAVAAFASVRNVPLAVIAASVPLARHAGLFAARRIHAAEALPGAPPPHLSARTRAIVALLAIILAAATGLFSPRLPAAMPYPDGAAAFMDAHSLHGDILNYFSWGQYLIWRESPESKIFIDGRFDLVYSPLIVRRYLDFYAALPDAASALAAYPHDYVLIPPAAPAYKFMLPRADWKLIYRDPDSALFARAESPAARIPTVIVNRDPPQSYFPSN